MVQNDTLFAHLAPRIAGGAENAAVEALAYILKRSKSAASAFNKLVEDAIGAPLEDCNEFRTQVVVDDNSRPDLVGYDKNGEKRVIGEAKFWARLLPGQGLSYLNQLPGSGNAVLLFVVPDARIDYLWGEVERDLTQGEESIELERTNTFNRTRAAKERDTGRHLMMVSWRDLLKEMHDHAAGETGIQEDIRQLQGLAERMDSEEFLPLSQDELGQNVARRMRDLGRIYEDVVIALGQEEWANNISSRNTAQPRTGYGKTLELSEYSVWFGVYLDLWVRGDCEDTPFWVQFYGWERPKLNQVTRTLGLQLSDNEYVPVHLKTGVELHAVVDDIIDQLKGIAEAIAGHG